MIRSFPSRGAGVLVDSSVWIDFYRGSQGEEARTAILEALARDAVFTVPVIVTEVVQGAPDDDALEALSDDFSALRPIALGPDVGLSAARIGFALRRRGRPAPAPDLIIAAAALSNECEIWHRDDHYRSISEVAPLRERAL